MVVNIDNNTIELYWDDLTERTKEELLNLWGENGNYDVFPIVELDLYEE